MRRPFSLALIVGASLIVASLTLASPSSGATKTRSVDCRHVAVLLTAGFGQVGGCGPHKFTGGNGTLSISSSLMDGAQIAWADGTKTAWTWTVTGPPPSGDEAENSAGSCPNGDPEYEFRGSVSSSTNAHIPVGEPVAAELCVVVRGTTTNEPRSVLHFGSAVAR